MEAGVEMTDNFGGINLKEGCNYFLFIFYRGFLRWGWSDLLKWEVSFDDKDSGVIRLVLIRILRDSCLSGKGG